MADQDAMSIETVRVLQSIAATGRYAVAWDELRNIVSQRLVEVVTSYDRQELGHSAIGLYTDAQLPSALATSVHTVVDATSPAGAELPAKQRLDETNAKTDAKGTGARFAEKTESNSGIITASGDVSSGADDLPSLLPVDRAARALSQLEQVIVSGSDQTADRVNNEHSHDASALTDRRPSPAQAASLTASALSGTSQDTPHLSGAAVGSISLGHVSTAGGLLPGHEAALTSPPAAAGAGDSSRTSQPAGRTDADAAAQASSIQADAMDVDSSTGSDAGEPGAGSAVAGAVLPAEGRNNTETDGHALTEGANGTTEQVQEDAGFSARSAQSLVSANTSTGREDGTGTVAAHSLVMEGSQGEDMAEDGAVHGGSYSMSTLASEDLEELQELLSSFVEEAPWTLQRICEILGTPRRYYSKLEKLTFGLRKCLAVQSTVPPCSPSRLVAADSEHPAFTQIGPVPKPILQEGKVVVTSTGGTGGAGGEDGSPRPQQGGSMRLTFSDPKNDRGGVGSGSGGLFFPGRTGTGVEEGGEYQDPHFGAVSLVDEDYDSDSDDDSGSSDSSEDMGGSSHDADHGGAGHEDDDGLEAHMHASARRIGQVGRASKGRIERELEQSDMAQALLAGAASTGMPHSSASGRASGIPAAGEEEDAEDIFPGVGKRVQRPREKSIDEDAFMVDADDEDRFIPPTRGVPGHGGEDRFTAPSMFRKTEEEEDDLMLRGRGAGMKRPASAVSGGVSTGPSLGLGLFSSLTFDMGGSSSSTSSLGGTTGSSMAGGLGMTLGGISIKLGGITSSSSSSSSPVAGPGLAMGMGEGGSPTPLTMPSHGSPRLGEGSARSSAGIAAMLSPAAPARGSSSLSPAHGRSLSPPLPHARLHSAGAGAGTVGLGLPGSMSPPGMHRGTSSTAPIATSGLGGVSWLQRPPSPPAGSSPHGASSGRATGSAGAGTGAARQRANSIGEAPPGYFTSSSLADLAPGSILPVPVPISAGSGSHSGALSPMSIASATDHMFSDHIPATHAKVILPDHGHESGGQQHVPAPGSASTVHRLSPSPLLGKGTGGLVPYGMEDGEDSSSSSGLSDSGSDEEDAGDHAKQVDMARQFRHKHLLGTGAGAGAGTAQGEGLRRQREEQQEGATEGIEPSPAKKARLVSE